MYAGGGDFRGSNFMMRHMDRNDSRLGSHQASLGWRGAVEQAPRGAVHAHVENRAHPLGRTHSGALLDPGFADVSRPQSSYRRTDPKFAAQDRKGPHPGVLAYGNRQPAAHPNVRVGRGFHHATTPAPELGPDPKLARAPAGHEHWQLRSYGALPSAGASPPADARAREAHKQGAMLVAYQVQIERRVGAARDAAARDASPPKRLRRCSTAPSAAALTSARGGTVEEKARVALLHLDQMLKRQGLLAINLFRDRVFNTSYSQGDDLLDVGEFRGILRRAGLKMSEADVQSIISYLDRDANGELDIDELDMAMREVSKHARGIEVDSLTRMHRAIAQEKGQTWGDDNKAMPNVRKAVFNEEVSEARMRAAVTRGLMSSVLKARQNQSMTPARLRWRAGNTQVSPGGATV